MDFSDNASSIRKAAVLIRSLDADSATRLLTQLRPEEAQALQAAMRDLGAVDEQELTCVAAELKRLRMPPSSPQQSGPAVVLELSGEVTGNQSSTADTPPPESPFNSQLADLRQLAASTRDPAAPFRSLIATDTQCLVEFLKTELPQTVAVVLSYLPAKKAAEALSGLTEEQQSEIVQRLAELGDTDADSLRVVEHSLEIWLAEQRREQLRHTDRLSIIGSILAATKDTTRQNILSRLQERNGRLAQQLKVQMSQRTSRANIDNSIATSGGQESRPKKHRAPEAYRRERQPNPSDRLNCAGTIDPAAARRASPSPDALLTFDRLVELPNQALTSLLRATDPQVLYCACAGASEQLLERISGALPRQQRKEFRHQRQSIGPIRLRDIEAAQRAVLHIASGMMSVSQLQSPSRQAA